jgi:hypothetical protein
MIPDLSIRKCITTMEDGKVVVKHHVPRIERHCDAVILGNIVYHIQGLCLFLGHDWQSWGKWVVLRTSDLLAGKAEKWAMVGFWEKNRSSVPYHWRLILIIDPKRRR